MQIACDYSDGASADVNRHPLAPNHLHHAINGEFSRSTFGRYDSADENDVPSPSQAGKFTKLDLLPRPYATSGYRRSPRKSEREPIYVLNISLPSNEIDNCVEPTKTAVHLMVVCFSAFTYMTFTLLHRTMASFLTSLSRLYALSCVNMASPFSKQSPPLLCLRLRASAVGWIRRLRL